MSGDESRPPGDDSTRRYVRREKKHDRSLLELDRLAAKRAAEAEKKKAERKGPTTKKK